MMFDSRFFLDFVLDIPKNSQIVINLDSAFKKTRNNYRNYFCHRVEFPRYAIVDLFLKRDGIFSRTTDFSAVDISWQR